MALTATATKVSARRVARALAGGSVLQRPLDPMAIGRAKRYHQQFGAATRWASAAVGLSEQFQSPEPALQRGGQARSRTGPAANVRLVLPEYLPWLSYLAPHLICAHRNSCNHRASYI